MGPTASIFNVQYGSPKRSVNAHRGHSRLLPSITMVLPRLTLAIIVARLVIEARLSSQLDWVLKLSSIRLLFFIMATAPTTVTVMRTYRDFRFHGPKYTESARERKKEASPYQ